MAFTLTARRALYLANTFWSPARYSAIVNREVTGCAQSVRELSILICIDQKK